MLFIIILIIGESLGITRSLTVQKRLSHFASVVFSKFGENDLLEIRRILEQYWKRILGWGLSFFLVAYDVSRSLNTFVLCMFICFGVFISVAIQKIKRQRFWKDMV